MDGNFSVDGLYDEGLIDIKYKDQFSKKELSSDVKSAYNRLSKYFEEKIDLPPYLGDVSVEVAPLDTYLLIDQDEDVISVSKVFGSLDPRTGKLKIDPVVLDKASPQKKFLEQYGIKIPTKEEIIMHELVHGVQRSLGIIDRAYSKLGERQGRIFLEGAAQYITNQILGKESKESDIYRDGVRHYRQNVKSKDSEREAFLSP